MTQPTENAQATNIKKAFEIVVAEIKALKLKVGNNITELGGKITALGSRLTQAEANHTALEQRVQANEGGITTLKATDQEIKAFLGTTSGDDLAAVMAKLNEE